MSEMNTLKKSNYCIIIKLDNDKSLLVHGYTGAIDEVKNNVVSLLYNYENEKFIDNKLIDYLVRRGYLTNKSKDEENSYIKVLTSELHNVRCITENKFLFLVAYDCNFRCPYCFESGISMDGERWSKKVISKEMVDSAYQIISTKNTENNNQITLYGGEPLLKGNYNIVKYIVDRGTAYGFRFNAITNGFDIDHYYDIINKENISTLQITIDGPPTLHNKTRILKSGDPTFEKILSNIKYCLEKEDVKINVRMNFNLERTTELEEILEIFDKNDWLHNKNFIYYTSPVMIQEISCNSNIKTDTNCNLENEEIKVAQPNVNRGQFSKHINSIKRTNSKFSKLILPCFDIENRIERIINKNSLSFIKSTYCAAHTGMLIFDPSGDLYSCWELVGKTNNKIGTYYPNIKYNDDILNQWKSRYVGNLPECISCKYVLFCGGGCAAQAINLSSTLFSSYCDGFQLMFHDAVKNYYKKKKINVNVL